MDRLHLNQHISQRYNSELENLRGKVLAMGGLVEEQVSNAVQALLEGDSQKAELVVSADYDINKLEVEIDSLCLELLARRQPTASDLRLILTVSKTIAHFEHIGDEAESIGRFAIKLANYTSPNGYYSELKHLGEHVMGMLHDMLDAFARLDAEAALEVANREDIVDQEFENLSRLLVTHMMEDPREIKNVLRLNWCARALERIADHASNVCEYIIFLVKGKDVRHTDIKQVREKLLGKN